MECRHVKKNTKETPQQFQLRKEKQKVEKKASVGGVFLNRYLVSTYSLVYAKQMMLRPFFFCCLFLKKRTLYLKAQRPANVSSNIIHNKNRSDKVGVRYKPKPLTTNLFSKGKTQQKRRKSEKGAKCFPSPPSLLSHIFSFFRVLSPFWIFH